MAGHPPSAETLPEWVRFGHHADPALGTGVSVFHFPERARGAVSIRGYAPSTRHTDGLLLPRSHAPVDAFVLAGGSALGLGAADGVVGWLRERGQGEAIREHRVPIVPSAILFDLGVGSDVPPDAAFGRAAIDSATHVVVPGPAGCGAGCTGGKLLGPERAVKLGAGWAGEHGPFGFLGVYVAVNAFGDVVDPDTGATLAAVRGDRRGQWMRTADLLADAHPEVVEHFRMHAPPPENTTLVVAVVEGDYDKAALTYLADYLQGSLRMAIRPSQTHADGDVVFLAGSRSGRTWPPIAVGCRLERLLMDAIRGAVRGASGAYGLPSPSEWVPA